MERRSLAIALAAALPFFFVGFGRDAFLAPLLDACHVLYFGGAAWLVTRTWPALAARPGWQRLGLLVAMAAVAGGVIELVQVPAGRSASLDDWGRDLAGAAIGGLLATPGGAARRHVAAQVLALVLALWLLTPALLRAADWWRAWHAFPVLADFGVRADARRWLHGRAASLAGVPVLAVELPAARPWAGTALFGPLGDWRGYRTLSLRLHLDAGAAVAMTLKLSDAGHYERGGAVDDRVNWRLRLQPGWQEVAIPLAAIATAGNGRAMDLARLRELALFVDAPLPHPRRLAIARVRLLR